MTTRTLTSRIAKASLPLALALRAIRVRRLLNLTEGMSTSR